MMRATNCFTSTCTGQPLVHDGFAHARQRSASTFASAGSKPRFTSSKLRARVSASRSGMCCRGSLMRSLFGIVLGMLFFPLRERFLLLRAIHGVALREHLEVDRVRVELRTVDACELRVAVRVDATAAAHSRAVDHDRVETDDRLDFPFARDVGD